MTCDNENNIWIGQNIGIEKFDAASEKFILYGRKQGFNGIETNENAVCKDASGNIWFGTIRGAIKFDPKQDAINPVEPLTHIEQLNIFMHDAPIEQNTTYDYDQNYLTFYTKGVCLTNPDEVHYKYRMVGFNDEWTEPTKTSQITYSNLGAGDYEFQVISNNNNCVWNTEPTTYTFSITPPFGKPGGFIPSAEQ